jgi:hypothetical protein
MILLDNCQSPGPQRKTVQSGKAKKGLISIYLDETFLEGK